jgi:hypothetical protein
MFHGKYWVTADGTIDVSASEHALYARRHMLGLAENDVR